MTVKSGGGRVAIVTGAAQGIGRGIAEQLAADGATVALVDLKEPTEAVEAIVAAGGLARGFVADVSSGEQVAAAVSAIRDELGPVSILVNNAGMHANPLVPLAELSYEAWRRMFSVDVDSMFYFSRAVIPDQQKLGWGRIVNMSSAAVNAHTLGGMTHYTAAKAAVVGLTRALASELGPFGITVNAVAPGGVRTPGLEEAAPEGAIEFVASTQAINKVIEPEDIAGAVSFLASDAAAMITAQVLFVDGGAIRAG